MLPGFIVLLSAFQTLADQFYILLRRAYTGFGFFLESVEDIDDAGKANRINTTVSIASMIFHDFKNTRPFTFPSLCMRMLRAKLGQAERVSHFRLNFIRKRLVILFGRSDPMQRLLIF